MTDFFDEATWQPLTERTPNPNGSSGVNLGSETDGRHCSTAHNTAEANSVTIPALSESLSCGSKSSHHWCVCAGRGVWLPGFVSPSLFAVVNP